MAGLDQAEDCPQRLRDALRWAIRLFAAHQADTPRLDAELLLAHVTELERVQLLARWNDCLTDTQVGQFSALVRRALADEPIAYLVGERAFYDITVEVNPAVLIPRHETEHIVEQALVWAAGHPGPVRIIDVGTGSGALAIVLARHLSSAQVWATDVSPAALAVAQQNARRYGLAERIRFQESDLLGAIDGRWDLIVANLPYVDQDELPQLQPSVRQYEPRIALDGGRGGTLVEYAVIAAVAIALALLIQAFLVKPYRIPTPSMVDTLLVKDRFLANRVVYHLREVERGDIVVFRWLENRDLVFVKRVMGLPGDTLQAKDGVLYVNGVPQDEPYVHETDGVTDPTQPAPPIVGTTMSDPWSLSVEYTVPEGSYFMMGDNRTNSDDSRVWGPVSEDDIIGTAFFIYWPLDRLGTI